MFKFIHTADLHLDSPLRGLERYDGAPVDDIRGATRRALENLVDLAVREQVDFIVISGDLYDGDWKDHNTGLFFVSQMTRLRDAGIPVIMISGNHDAVNKMTRSLALPDNVEFLSHRKTQSAANRKLSDLGVVVHGRSFANSAESENLARQYPDRREGHYNIGLLHTSLSGHPGHEPYAPCSLDELLQKEYDYWALGHIHTRAVVHGDPPIVYCGNLQGRHIRETGAKGCCLVTVDGYGKSRIEFQPLDVFRWEVCSVAVDDLETPDEALSQFMMKLADLHAENQGLPLAVRVLLTGRCAAHHELAADAIQWVNDLRSRAMAETGNSVWIEKVRFQTSPLGPALGETLLNGPLGSLHQQLEEIRGDEALLRELAGELADLRRKLPPELLGGEESLDLEDPVRLKPWLDEVEPLLVHRLLGGRPR